MKKPRPIKAIGRKRRAAGWMLLTLGVLVAAVWVASRWWALTIWYGKAMTTVWFGRIDFFGSEERAEPQPLDWEFELNLPIARKYKWWVDRSFMAVPNGWTPDIGHGWIVTWQKTPLTRGGPNELVVQIVLWPLPLMLWTTGGLALWSGRRARRRALEGHCPTCGYNLAGLNRDAGVGVCPECGTVRSGAGRMNAGS